MLGLKILHVGPWFPFNMVAWDNMAAFRRCQSCQVTTSYVLTRWGQATHLSVSKLTTIGSDNGLSPDRRQSIIWTNAGILLIEPLGTKFKEILTEICTFTFKKMHLKMSSGKWRSFCLGHNVLMFILSRKLLGFAGSCLLRPVYAHMRYFNGLALVQPIAWPLLGTKPLPGPIPTFHQLRSCKINFRMEIASQIQFCLSRSCIWKKSHLQKVSHFVQTPIMLKQEDNSPVDTGWPYFTDISWWAS